MLCEEVHGAGFKRKGFFSSEAEWEDIKVERMHQNPVITKELTFSDWVRCERWLSPVARECTVLWNVSACSSVVASGNCRGTESLMEALVMSYPDIIPLIYRSIER